MNEIKVGTKVVYRGSWGSDKPKIVTIESMELCQREGDKYGKVVNEIPWYKKNFGCYTLSDGHWCYGYQIERIAKKHKVILEHTRRRVPIEEGYGLVKLNLVLNEFEYEHLKACIDIYGNGTIALYNFTHGEYCTKHHKYAIWNMGEGDINIYINN